MLQLRIVSPPHCTDDAVRLLAENEGVVSVELRRGAAVKPADADVIVADVLREHANELIDGLRALEVDEVGELSLIEIETMRSEPAHRASRRIRGRESDVIVWTLLDQRVHQDGVPSIAFYCFMAVAALIATIAILVDSSVLLVGAMVVGPEYGPLAAFAVAIDHRERRAARVALFVLITGLALGIVVSGVAAFVFIGFDENIVPHASRFFTRFVTEPNAYSAIVAFASGLVGVMAVGLSRSAALMGVVVSATTIPAAAAIGVNAADGTWDAVVGGALQLTINVVCLTAGSLVALVVYQALHRRLDAAPPNS